MKNLIYKADIIGFTPVLHINSYPHYRSIFTGLLSILIIVLSLACVGYFGSEIFTKTTPTVITTQDIRDDFAKIKFSNSEFNFIIGMEFANNAYFVILLFMK